MPFAVVLILLVVGTVIFHVYSQNYEWWFTDLASNWGMVDFTVDITIYVTGFVFVAVNLFMAYCVIKFRHKKGARATYEPENKKLESLADGSHGYWRRRHADARIVCLGRFRRCAGRRPCCRGGLVSSGTGRSDFPVKTASWARSMPSESRTTTRSAWIPRIRTARMMCSSYDGEITYPVDKPVKFLLRSKDVLHDFAVAQFRVKMDLVPGTNTFLWLTPTKTGRFEILCARNSAVSRTTRCAARPLSSRVTDYRPGSQAQSTYEELNSAPAGNAARRGAVRGMRGLPWPAGRRHRCSMNAPKIAGQSAWYLKRQIMNYKKGLRGTHADDTYGAADDRHGCNAG